MCFVFLVKEPVTPSRLCLTRNHCGATQVYFAARNQGESGDSQTRDHSEGGYKYLAATICPRALLDLLAKGEDGVEGHLEVLQAPRNADDGDA